MEIRYFLLQNFSPRLEESHFVFVQQLQLAVHVSDLLRNIRVLLGSWLPVTDEVLQYLQPFHQVVQLEENSEVLLGLVVLDVNLHSWMALLLIFLLLLLLMDESQLFDHAVELHHVH